MGPFSCQTPAMPAFLPGEGFGGAAAVPSSQVKNEVFRWRHEASKDENGCGKGRTAQICPYPPTRPVHACPDPYPSGGEAPALPSPPCQAGGCCRPPLTASPDAGQWATLPEPAPAALHKALAPHGRAMLPVPHRSPSPECSARARRGVLPTPSPSSPYSSWTHQPGTAISLI